MVGMRAARVVCGERDGLRRSNAVSAIAATMPAMVRAPSTKTMTRNHDGGGVPCDSALEEAPAAKTNATKLVAAARTQPWRRCSNRTAAATSGSATEVPGCDENLTRQA